MNYEGYGGDQKEPESEKELGSMAVCMIEHKESDLVDDGVGADLADGGVSEGPGLQPPCQQCFMQKELTTRCEGCEIVNLCNMCTLCDECNKKHPSWKLPNLIG